MTSSRRTLERCTFENLMVWTVNNNNIGLWKLRYADTVVEFGVGGVGELLFFFFFFHSHLTAVPPRFIRTGTTQRPFPFLLFFKHVRFLWKNNNITKTIVVCLFFFSVLSRLIPNTFDKNHDLRNIEWLKLNTLLMAEINAIQTKMSVITAFYRLIASLVLLLKFALNINSFRFSAFVSSISFR